MRGDERESWIIADCRFGIADFWDELWKFCWAVLRRTLLRLYLYSATFIHNLFLGNVAPTELMTKITRHFLPKYRHDVAKQSAQCYSF